MSFKERKESLKKLISLNLFPPYCPDCARVVSNPSAKFCRLWNEQYRRYEFYIKCKYCKNVTPAFVDPKKALDNWDDLFIKKENQLILEG